MSISNSSIDPPCRSIPVTQNRHPGASNLATRTCGAMVGSSISSGCIESHWYPNSSSTCGSCSSVNLRTEVYRARASSERRLSQNRSPVRTRRSGNFGGFVPDLSRSRSGSRPHRLAPLCGEEVVKFLALDLWVTPLDVGHVSMLVGCCRSPGESVRSLVSERRLCDLRCRQILGAAGWIGAASPILRGGGRPHEPCCDHRASPVVTRAGTRTGILCQCGRLHGPAEFRRFSRSLGRDCTSVHTPGGTHPREVTGSSPVRSTRAQRFL